MPGFAPDILSFYDADPEFGVDLEWSPVEYEESWGAMREARPAGRSVEDVTLFSICIGGKSCPANTSPT
ncbi:hypothetical protein [Aliiruegeria lutimaris]|uniref:Uncharacterized protein n=1 Tax=Aliiruegeria lutimaris TaxID=571298 RepID=A0A1G9CC39_9RHOB|nr:hypothetical protein [Aliiruegeria lutimaris]SDK49176.1 hypothetical protein SAMN04488026_10432 [Aliiruegeria lutimaris]